MEQEKNASVKRKLPPLGWWTVAAAILAILAVWAVIDRPYLAKSSDFEADAQIIVDRDILTASMTDGPQIVSETRHFDPGQPEYETLRALLENTRCALSPKALADDLRGTVEDVSEQYSIMLPSLRVGEVSCGKDGWVQAGRYRIYGQAGEQFLETMNRLVPVEEGS